MGQINRIPFGYLDLLQTQTGGKNPSQASETVVPMLEMRNLYEQHKTAAQVGLILGPLAIGDSVTIDVPNDEVWLLEGVSYRHEIETLNDNLTVGVQVRGFPKGTAGLFVPIAYFDSRSLIGAIAGSRVSGVQRFDDPIPLLPGSDIIFLIESQTGASANAVNCFVQYVELEI